MKVVICGAGQVGYGIAEYLSKTGADVVVIDTNPNLLKVLTESLDIQGVLGHASLPSVLESAGLGQAELLVAVTALDEVNIVACQIAHHLFKTPMKIARIREQAYLLPEWSKLFSNKHLAIDITIFPEGEVANSIEQILNYPGSFDVIPLTYKNLHLMGVVLKNNSPLLHIPFSKIPEAFPKLDFFIIGLFRDNQFMYPNPHEHLKIGDEIYFITIVECLNRLMAALGHNDERPRKIIIAGGGRVGIRLAEGLSKHTSLSFKIFEMNSHNAEQAALRLQGSRGKVILGNVLEQTTFLKQELKEVEAFVAVTNHDETNILSSLLAKQLGAERTICLTNSPNYNTLLSPLGIDSLINPRLITVSSVLRLIRRGHIHSIFTLKQQAGEIIEIEVKQSSKLAWRLIEGRMIDKGVRILALIRDKESYIQNLPLKIHPYDHLILSIEAGALNWVQKLLSDTFHYF